VNPITNPGAYNTVRLGGRLWSGKVDVAGAADLAKWEKVAGQGFSGAWSKYGGEELCDLAIKFYCWETKHFDQFESEFRPMFAPPAKGKKPQALLIEHPECTKLKITKVVKTSLGMLEAEGDQGLWFYPVAFQKFGPPKPVQVLKAKGAEGGPDDPSQQLSKNQAMIQELTKQLKEEAAK
jgi:hypothetical protein